MKSPIRKSIIVYINGCRHELKGADAFMTVATYLRHQKGLTGTKIICSEGDCGACTVLVSRFDGKKMGQSLSVNSCISFMYLLDRCHLITVEGLKKLDHLHPVQKAMIKHQGAQCGYCTPGIVCAMAAMTEDAKNNLIKIDDKKVKNYLTGNLCRCTGYEPIIKAGTEININDVKKFNDIYNNKEMISEYKNLILKDVKLENNNQDFLHSTCYLPASYKSFYKNGNIKNAKIISGATDIGVAFNKGKLPLKEIISFNNILEAYKIKNFDNKLVIGAKASLTDVEKACKKDFFEFSKSLHIFASAQIKNQGTLVGNLINASPIGDTIAFLRVSQAKVVLHNAKAERSVFVNNFFLGGYKKLDIKNNEIVTHIIIPKQKVKFKIYKVSTRKDLDISSVNMAIAYQINKGVFTSFKLCVGGVGPTALRLPTIENALVGKNINQKTFKKTFQNIAKTINTEIKPLSDVRGTSDYRKILVHNLLLKFYDEVILNSNNASKKIINEASI